MQLKLQTLYEAILVVYIIFLLVGSERQIHLPFTRRYFKLDLHTYVLNLVVYFAEII